MQHAKEDKKRILIIEDDNHIAEGLELNLTMRGHEVCIANDGISGLGQWKAYQPDLIVLDIMLPGIDGLSVLRNIRLEDEQIPILILSARGTASDRIEGLSHGVDDYLSKPFNLEEFLLRVERLLIKDSWYRENGKPISSFPGIFEFGGNRIDLSSGNARCIGGKEVQLTEQEIKLIKAFIVNSGKPLSRKKLLEIAWGYSGRIATRTVDNFIVRFRKYFERDPSKPVYFKSIRSIGYLFNYKPDI